MWKLRSSDATSEYSSTLFIDDTIDRIRRLDADLEAMLLNHVARRASKAQGIALLALYSRAFANEQAGSTSAQEDPIQIQLDGFMEKLKMASRGRSATIHGHLPICFPVLCAALGLSLSEWIYMQYMVHPEVY